MKYIRQILRTRLKYPQIFNAIIKYNMGRIPPIAHNTVLIHCKNKVGRRENASITDIQYIVETNALAPDSVNNREFFTEIRAKNKN